MGNPFGVLPGYIFRPIFALPQRPRVRFERVVDFGPIFSCQTDHAGLPFPFKQIRARQSGRVLPWAWLGMNSSSLISSSLCKAKACAILSSVTHPMLPAKQSGHYRRSTLASLRSALSDILSRWAFRARGKNLTKSYDVSNEHH